MAGMRRKGTEPDPLILATARTVADALDAAALTELRTVATLADRLAQLRDRLDPAAQATPTTGGGTDDLARARAARHAAAAAPPGP